MEFDESGNQQEYSEDENSEIEANSEIIEEGKAAAILGYIPFLCFIPLIKMNDNPFALKHGKQGLLLFFIEILAVFFMFDFISNLFWGMVLIVSAGIAVVGILYAVQGKIFEIPFIGEWAKKINI